MLKQTKLFHQTNLLYQLGNLLLLISGFILMIYCVFINTSSNTSNFQKVMQRTNMLFKQKDLVDLPSGPEHYRKGWDTVRAVP